MQFTVCDTDVPQRIFVVDRYRLYLTEKFSPLLTDAVELAIGVAVRSLTPGDERYLCDLPAPSFTCIACPGERDCFLVVLM